MSEEEPQAPAFQQLTANNHGPAVVVASYIFLAITVIVVFTRLITRFQITRELAVDDYLISASTLLAIGQTVTITVAVNHGLGRHREAISDLQFDGFAKVCAVRSHARIRTNNLQAFYTARILAIVTLCLAKSSTNFLIMGIHPPRPVMLACKATLVTINVWAFAAILATIFECNPPRVWDYKGQCVDQWALYVANVVWNVSTDVALILLPFFLMRNVQVAFHKKLMVVVLFGSRIIVPAFAIAGAVATVDYWQASPSDPTWQAVNGALWSQAVINLSIITACIPCIKRFLAELSTGMMTVNISEPMELTMKNVSSSGGGDPTSTRNGGGFLSSKLFSSRGKSQMNSQLSTTDHDTGEKHRSHATTFAPTNQSTNKICVERSESMKGLTEGVIMQTIDYEVNFEQARDSAVWDGSSGSHRLESRPSQGSSPPNSRVGKQE